MKISAPHSIIGPLMHELHDSSVGAVLMERTGPGWMIEFMTRIDQEAAGRIVRMGAQIIGPNEGTP